MSREPVCVRCWSSKGLNHHRAGGTTLLLCRQCREGAPKDPEILEKVYLQYSSLKELLRRYGTEDEVEAITRLATETRVDPVRARKEILGVESATGDAHKVVSWLELMRPFGYELTPHGWAVKEDEARIVARIYELYLGGQGVLKICAHLNKNGASKTKTGKNWKPQTVANILKNPVYCGYTRKGKRDDRPPIVSVRDFNRAQEAMDRRIRRPDQKVLHKRLPEESAPA